MSFRTVVIKNRSKIDFSLNYLVYRGKEQKKIHLSEISLLIIESTAVSLTSALINELIKHNIKVVFCDEKHLPHSQLVGFYENYHSSKNVLTQTTWSQDIKAQTWTEIIRQKIHNQSKVLQKYNLPYGLLVQYLTELEEGDATNREGHAAKVYFNHLFGEFSRRIPSLYNSALNYGYAILLSAFCREITTAGYITQLGVWHCNEYNHFNLASDLMEPFRVIVDEVALTLVGDDPKFKSKMANILNAKVKIGGKVFYLDAAINIYTKSVLNALNKQDVTKILNYTSYELPIYENNDNV